MEVYKPMQFVKTAAKATGFLALCWAPLLSGYICLTYIVLGCIFMAYQAVQDDER